MNVLKVFRRFRGAKTFTKLLSMHLKYEVNLSKTDVIRMHASYNFTAF